MRATDTILRTLLLSIVLLAGCREQRPDEPLPNHAPVTHLWLFPDSIVAEGVSRQHLRWWGEDPDGVVKGFLFTSGKIVAPGGTLSPTDTLRWSWTTRNDTLLAFPLVTKRDTFDVAVRSVDNRFTYPLPEQAIVRLSPSPYWDVNDNGTFDGGDVGLPSMGGSYDPIGTTLPLPLLNQPPSIVFAQNPNDPTSVMVQPETTFTAATFSWVGSDPDGDQTIAGYEIALNDSLNDSSWVKLEENISLISIVVPRQRSDTAGAVVTADLYIGKYSSVRVYYGAIPNLRLDALNTFYIRARDVAGDVSQTIQTPSPGGRWYVKRPRSKLLIISDYIGSDSATALNFYRQSFSQIPGFDAGDVLNISRGVTAQQKRNGRVGVLVPPFVDPAFLYTLHLFDLVFWYTDPIPSLSVAQYPLYQYVRDPSHRGKVIFSTAFESSSDPRGALKDFAPIDSVSSVNLATNRLLPTLGDSRIPELFALYPDSSDLSSIYPLLRFAQRGSFYSAYLRPIYRRADARYIYHMQPDTGTRYAYSEVISELRSVTSVGSEGWACGMFGALLHSSNYGISWSRHPSFKDTSQTFHAVRFRNANDGWVVGNGGVILSTHDGGSTWSDISILTLENLYGLDYPSDTSAVIVGSNGLLIRSTDGGRSWRSPSSTTTRNLRSVKFYDANNGVAVGDFGTIIKTADGGATWTAISAVTSRNLYAVDYATTTQLYAAGATGSLLRSTDAGDSWVVQSSPGTSDLRGITFLDATTGFVCGGNGGMYRTQNGGVTWTPQPTRVAQGLGNGQILTAVRFSDANRGLAVATGGIIIATQDGGTSWFTVPSGNLELGVIDGVGSDGHRSFAFLAMPLHYLNGDGTNVRLFLEKVILEEFGF